MLSSPRLRFPWLWLLAVSAAAGASLLPWWRHRAYLRDFYDYGLVMAGVGRIASGERPYVDFVTPIQSGIFLFNGWAERLGGGTFQGMTTGCAVLIMLAIGILSGILSRRWPVAAAAAVAAVVVCGSLVQHTIIWHNSLGVLCLAVVALASAIAPVWRRADWGWQVLIGLALLVGGLNKLNFQLVAMTVVLAWLVRARVNGGATGRHLLAGVGLVVGCGVVLPVLVELAWTGASLTTWWQNVVGLSAGGRAAHLTSLFEVQSYLRPIHDYYGTLRLPQVGAVGLVMTLGVVVVASRQAWLRKARADAWLALAAGVGSALASVALMATNHEIAYVGLAAWLALLASLWLGFDLPRGGLALHAGLVLPAVLVGAVFWESAWNGQRAQFGHSGALRADYVPAENAGKEFAYLRGTRVPPEVLLSMSATAEWRSSPFAAQASRVFHGPGLEFLDRIWPAPLAKGQPLWMHIGTSYLRDESIRLSRELLAGGRYDFVLVPHAYDHWPHAVRAALDGSYEKQDRGMGPAWKFYKRVSPLQSEGRSPFAFMGAFGGNVHAGLLESDMDVFPSAAGALFLGVQAGEGSLRLTSPSHRLKGEMVVVRTNEGGVSAPWSARFDVFAEAGDGSVFLLQSAVVELPPQESGLVQTFTVGGQGNPLNFVVTPLSETEGRHAAGWRALQIMHAFDGPDVPGRFSSRASEFTPLDETALQALLPDQWRPAKAFTRGGRMTPEGFELPPHGEVWLWVENLVSELSGEAIVPPEVPLTGPPFLRALGYKGGRIEITSQGYMDAASRRLEFRTWSPEWGSWLVLAAADNDNAPAMRVKVTRVTIAE